MGENVHRWMEEEREKNIYLFINILYLYVSVADPKTFCKDRMFL